MELSKKQKKKFSIFSAVSEIDIKFEYFEKKMTLIAYVFPNLETAKDVVS